MGSDISCHVYSLVQLQYGDGLPAVNMRQIYHDAITAKTSALLFCLYGVLIQTSVRLYTITWVPSKIKLSVTCHNKYICRSFGIQWTIHFFANSILK